MNPLFSNAPQNSSFGNFQDMLMRFNQFKSTFQGNPQAIVQNMLQSGQVTQEQYQQAQSMANQFMRMMRGNR